MKQTTPWRAARGAIVLTTMLFAGGCPSKTTGETDPSKGAAHGEPSGGSHDAAGGDAGAASAEVADASRADLAAVDGKIERLADEHPYEKEPAREWLAENADISRGRLVELAESRDIDRRVFGAFEVLGRIGHPEDVPLLARIVREEEDTIMWAARSALANHSHDSALEAILELLEEPDLDMRRAAITALGIRGDEGMRDLIEGKLESDQRLMRFQAAHALGMLGAEPSLNKLRSRLEREDDDEVRRKIRKVISGINADAAPPFDPYAEAWEFADAGAKVRRLRRARRRRERARETDAEPK